MYNPQSWLRLTFDFNKGDTFNMLWKGMVGVAVYTAALVYIEKNVLQIANSAVIHSLLGFVISLLLVFRTNTAYERWWEGRRQWNNLVASARSLCYKYNAIIGTKHTDDKQYFYSLVSNLGFALKDHLRGASSDKALMNADVDTEFGSTHSDHMPNHINTLLYKHIVSLRHAELIDPTQMRILDIDIGQINQIVSNCERIKATPIPYSYRIFIKKFLFVYIFTLPFGFGEQLGYYLAPIVSFVFYVLLSLEVLAESIEDPFGTDTEDLPLDGMSKMIQKDAAQILGLEYKQ